MTKKKTEVKVVGKKEELSDQTWKAQAEQYKRDNKQLLEKTKNLEKEIAWLTEELTKLRQTNQSLIAVLHGR